jgi:hypothetical protein
MVFLACHHYSKYVLSPNKKSGSDVYGSATNIRAKTIASIERRGKWEISRLIWPRIFGSNIIFG